MFVESCEIEWSPLMVEIIIHGRGGQGVVIASEVLASALFKEGKHVQAFPSFGAERRGAAVAAYLRFDDEPIQLRCQIYHPDHVIVLDETLLADQATTRTLKEGGSVVVNSRRNYDDSKLKKKFAVATVDAITIAVRHRLGSPSAPIVNTAILGAFSKATGLVSLDSIEKTIEEFVPTNQADNVAATRAAFNLVKF